MTADSAAIALIGGGQIGGNLALLATQKELGDIVIYDIPQAEGMTKGKSLDIMQLRPHDGYDASVEGTSNPTDTGFDKQTDLFKIRYTPQGSSWNQYFELLSSKKQKEIKVVIRTSIGTSYLLEIAKLRRKICRPKKELG